jgi:E3 ubiquitin-protein ligase HUWE1
MGWGWDEEAPPTVRHTHRLSPWMFPTGPGDRILVPAFRTHRPGVGPRAADDGLNPLLQRAGRSSARGFDSPFPGSRFESNDWLQSLEGRGQRAAPGETPVSFISNLLNAMSQGAGNPFHQHNGTFHLSFPLGVPPPLDPIFRRGDIPRTRDNHTSRSTREDPQSAVTFHKAATNARWQEEAKILYGATAMDKAQRVINSILKNLVPPAIEAAKKRQAEKEAEIARKLKEEQERKEQKEREEREAREAKEREEREQQEREAAEAAARVAEAGTEGQPARSVAEDNEAMEGIEAAQPSAEEAVEVEPSETRVTAVVRGREVDIGALGIDLEYLEALPEELREEVLLQQITEHRSQATQAGDNPEGISQEFLDALPSEIREELLQQEAAERRRREREETRRRTQAASGAPARAEDMDPASFLASLDPQLRNAVLMEQDDDVLRQLPAEIAAEARALGGDRRLNQFNDYLPPGYRRSGDRRAQADDPSLKKKSRPCVQMLDKAGVATLLRLMFIPQQGSAKASLSHILRNVCENRQNRAEVISILLSILQDGSADVSAVERSFAQLSLRAKQPQHGADKTPKPSRKISAPSVNSEVSPLMVVQQCLQTLWQLTDNNRPVWNFFLTEHETAVSFKRGNKKGKAKETKATKYPVNALLGLLDRKLIIESSAIMEQLTTLLRVITSPLQALRKEKLKTVFEAEKQDEPPTEEGHAPAAAAPAPAPAPAPATTVQAADQASGQDTDMASPAEGSAQGNAATEGVEATKPDEKKSEKEKEKKHPTLVAPDLPEQNLRLVAKILAARECNAKVFQETLSVISNLSPVPGAKEIFGKELLGIAQDLAQSTLKDLANLTTQVSKAESPTDVQGMALSKFSPPSSDQAKLLRALTALDYLFDPSRNEKEKADTAAEGLEIAQKEDILLTLYENSTFGALWNKLSECLAVIRQRGNMLNIATILLPLIEALMVVCKNTTLKELPLAKMLPKEFALSSPPPENRMENLFFNFTEDHRKILNDLVRQNPKLMSGTFSLLVKNSKVLEFDNKRNYFSRKLHARAGDRDRHAHPPLQLAVRREIVFLDSFKSLYFKTADEMKYGKLSIRFHGEEGVDAGGVTREWFQVIARQMFNADYALFVPVASDRTTFHPNRLSAINPEHLMFFKFIGRIIGKALYENRVLDCHFSRAVYKRILGKSVNLKDMETLDLEYYKSLQWMLENDITDIITETFSVDVEAFGETQTVDLLENGRHIPVTEDNKQEYVRLVTEHRLTGAVQEQLEHFLKGFHDIVPAELVSIFSEQELELLISGLPDINVDDWKNNTEYHNYTAASPQIQWFWRAVRSFDKEERAKLLQFVTGTSKVPLNGFRELEGMNGFSRFNIHRDYGSKDRLPSSHTCFNRKFLSHALLSSISY